MWYSELSNLEIWIYVTLFLIGRYMGIAGAFYLCYYIWFKKKLRPFKIQRKIPGNKQLKEELLYSVLTFLIYGSGIWIFLYWMAHGMTKKYEHIEILGVPYFVFSIVIMIVMHDAYFYWTHKAIHHPRIFPFVHRVHHRFKNPTPWAAFAFHPLEAILSMGIIPLIIFTIPFHHGALLCFITFMVLHTIMIHLGFEVKGIWFSKIQNTSMEHDYHHHKGHGNYGLYFTFWDKLMGTYVSSPGRQILELKK